MMMTVLVDGAGVHEDSAHCRGSKLGVPAGKNCPSHGNNFYGYRECVQKIWYLKITKVHIFKSI